MKIAIIGLGVIGKVHAEALSILGTPASALCDVDENRIDYVKNKFAPQAANFTDWKKMLSEYKPDSVHICTPHYLHTEMIIEALRQNINVLCEKPLCISEDEVVSILKAEQESKAVLGVCHQNRYNDVNVFLKNYLSDKKIQGAYGTVMWHRTEEYYHSAEWRGHKDTEGGGVMINQALHTLDLLIWLCGQPSSVSSANANLTLKDTIEVEDTIAISCKGETEYFFTATNGAPASFPVELNFKLENGDHILALPNVVLLNGKVIDTEENKRALGKDCYGNGHIRLMQDFYDCLKNGRPFSINGKEGAKVVRTILKAYESNKNN